nr:hypothetical protein Iba_chr09fCG7420 [Ipomoea batatas]
MYGVKNWKVTYFGLFPRRKNSFELPGPITKGSNVNADIVISGGREVDTMDDEEGIDNNKEVVGIPEGIETSDGVSADCPVLILNIFPGKQPSHGSNPQQKHPNSLPVIYQEVVEMLEPYRWPQLLA